MPARSSPQHFLPYTAASALSMPQGAERTWTTFATPVVSKAHTKIGRFASLLSARAAVDTSTSLSV